MELPIPLQLVTACEGQRACYISLYMRIGIATLVVLLLAGAVIASEVDAGTLRLQRLQERSNKESNRIIPFNKQDFQEYVMKYPRPYDVVIYFTAKSCKLCSELYPEFEYMVDLYENYGAIDTQSYPTFFATIIHSSENQEVFEQFGFNTAPNIVVSKPHMAVVSEIEKRLYLQQFKWSISSSDGQVETHKMLEFVNKRTDKDVIYKPTVLTMCKMFFGFIIVALVGVFAYIRLKFIWNHWVFWLVGSLLIYVTCCSGIIYDIIHDVPFTGRDPKTGETIIFSGGNREQYGLEGWIVSISITLVGLFFISVVVSGQKYAERYSAVVGVVAIILIYFVVTQLEKVYKEKGWYGPNFYPPDGYLSGPLSKDQGNNI